MKTLLYISFYFLPFILLSQTQNKGVLRDERNLLIEIFKGMKIPDNILELSEERLEKSIKNDNQNGAEYAMFLSLYYLGFPKEIIGTFRILSNHSKNIFPVASTKALIKRGKARDLDKAMYYAKKAESMIKYIVSDYAPIFKYRESLLFEKIGDEKEIEEFFEELKEDYELKKQRFNEESTKLERLKTQNLTMYRSIVNSYHFERYAYMYYRAYGGFEKDLEKAKYYASLTHISFWANFYTGYAFPLDPEFAIFLLESINSDEAKQILNDINAGVYNKN